MLRKPIHLSGEICSACAADVVTESPVGLLAENKPWHIRSLSSDVSSILEDTNRQHVHFICQSAVHGNMNGNGAEVSKGHSRRRTLPQGGVVTGNEPVEAGKSHPAEGPNPK